MSGFYTFRWDRPATEVYVTGTFDGWSRSTKLERAGDTFVKKVELPTEKILYKFVVDGDWVIDPNAPLETDSSGIQNNILSAQTIEQITEEPDQDMSQAAISLVAPDSTTDLAGAVPKEHEPVTNGKHTAATISSAAPESTTAALAGEVSLVNATPGTDAAPGGFPGTPATEVNPTAAPASQQLFSVNPLPASDTAENPITLQPGEPVPKDIGTQSIHSNVKLDKEFYEKGATNFPLNTLTLPDAVTPAEARAAEERGILDIPKNLIPESSLPITSAAEAEVAKQAEVPEIVKESQEKAEVPPGASAGPENVEVRAEAESEVAVKPPAAEGNTAISQTKDVVAGVATQARDAAADVAATIPSNVAGVADLTSTADPIEEPAADVPEIVQESIAKAGVPAEATVVEASVEAKKEFESELKQKVPEVKPSTETVPPLADENAAKAATQTAPVVKTATMHKITLNKPVESVPEPVKESVAGAAVPAGAAGNAVGVRQKEVVEAQLKKRQAQPTQPVLTANGNGIKSAAPKSEPATAAPTEPATNGYSKASTDAARSSAGSSKKKSKRRSFFGKLKEIFF